VFSWSFGQLIAWRGGGGLGSAMYTVSAQSLLLASVPDDQRGRASGVFSAGFLLGAVSGPAVGGLVAEAVGYAAAFNLAAAVLGVAAILGYLAPETRS
jgi:MFS transporter, DHA1 family, multidrug resistance protein